jgi:hypothetical protein
VKKPILEQQVSLQRPDPFSPSGAEPGYVLRCKRPDRPLKVAPGENVDESWEAHSSDSLFAAGSAATLLRVEVVEARHPDELQYLDPFATGEAGSGRTGRNLRIEASASRVVGVVPPAANQGLSLGQLYDRLVATPSLRAWIEAQPADSWKDAWFVPSLQPVPPDSQMTLTLLTGRFERGATVTARGDGTHVLVELPTEADRSRVFGRRPAELPRGVEVRRLPDGQALGDDLLVGKVLLPSGRVVVGEFLYNDDTLALRVAPGSYPAYATLVWDRRHRFETPALATLVLSNSPTRRWKKAGLVSVDGGTATFSSPEGAAAVIRISDRSQASADRLSDRIIEALTAHDYLAANFDLDGKVNLVTVHAGAGDGVYRYFVGYDAGGRPTRVVIDFDLIELGWPR